MMGFIAVVVVLIFLGMIDLYNLLKDIRDQLRKMNGEDKKEGGE